MQPLSSESAVTAKAQTVYKKQKLEDMVLPTMVSPSDHELSKQPCPGMAQASRACCIANLIESTSTTSTLLQSPL